MPMVEYSWAALGKATEKCKDGRVDIVPLIPEHTGEVLDKDSQHGNTRAEAR